MQSCCPGFDQDRVNFHRTPERATAGGVGADPTWPNRSRYSIPWDVIAGFRCGGGAAATHSWLGSVRRRCGPRERICFCRVFSLSLSSLLLFPLFALLLNCPYPDPLVFCLFSFHSPPHPGGRRGGCVALLLPAAAETKTLVFHLLARLY